MAGLRFLERLRRAQGEAGRRGSEAPEEVLASVADYVGKILNTRQGSTVLAEDFGIPDFTSQGLAFTNEDIPRLEREIAAFVERCEPRLRHVAVRFAPGEGAPLRMTFDLEGELNLGREGPLPVHFVTRVDPMGQVTVSNQA